jgi:hypothetical protein
MDGRQKKTVGRAYSTAEKEKGDDEGREESVLKKEKFGRMRKGREVLV